LIFYGFINPKQKKRLKPLFAGNGYHNTYQVSSGFGSLRIPLDRRSAGIILDVRFQGKRRLIFFD
jgi:hypothetical protein